MIQVLISFKKSIARFLLLLLLIFPVMFFLNIGFLTDSIVNLSQTVIFAVVLSTILVWSNVRRFVLVVSLSLIIVMAILFIFDLIHWADILGSTGVGLVMINLVSYLPQLVKLGYIKKL